MFDNDGLAVNIVAPAGGVTAGNFVYDAVTGWAGFALDTVDAGEGVALEIARGHRFLHPKSESVVAGDILHVTNAGTLSKTPSATARPFLKVTEVVEDVTGTQDQVIGNVLPQNWAKFAIS